MSAHSADLTISVYSYTGAISQHGYSSAGICLGIIQQVTFTELNGSESQEGWGKAAGENTKPELAENITLGGHGKGEICLLERTSSKPSTN